MLLELIGHRSNPFQMSFIVTFFSIVCIVGFAVPGKRVMEKRSKQIWEHINDSNLEDLDKYELENMAADLAISYIMRGQVYQYLKKLDRALTRENKRMDEADDPSNRKWAIKACMPDDRRNSADVFTRSSACLDQTLKPTCDVERAEYVMAIPRNRRLHTPGHTFNILVNGQTVTSSRGTVSVPRALVFDLTDIVHCQLGTSTGCDHTQNTSQHLAVQLIENQNSTINHTWASSTSNPTTNTTTTSTITTSVIHRSVLYVYCNINATILETFWNYSLTRGKGAAARTESARHDPQSSSRTSPNASIRRNEVTPTVQSNLKSKQPVKLDLDGFEEATDEELKMLYSKRRKRSTPRDMWGKRSTRNAVRGKKSARNSIRSRVQRSGRNRIIDQCREDVPALGKKLAQPHFQPTIQGCQRERLMVDLRKHLGYWHIIYPQCVDIGVCTGSCSHSLSFSSVNEVITAHAVIMNNIHDMSVAPIACTPHRMSTILIWETTATAFIIKNLSNARVESCRCTGSARPPRGTTIF